MGLFWKGLGKAVAGNVPVIGSMISSAIDAKQSQKNVDQTIRHQKEMAEYAYGKDLEQWKRSNLYNEPSQQMARLRDAGLNPNLIYGQGGGITQATTSPKYQAPRPDYAGRRNPLRALGTLQMYNDLRMRNAQADTAEEKAQQEELSTEMKTMVQDWMKTKTNFKTVGSEILMKPRWAQLQHYQKDYAKQKTEHEAKKVRRVLYDNTIKKFEVDMWNDLKKYGKYGQIGLPFLKMLLGR